MKKSKEVNKVGLWIDHSEAHIINPYDGEMQTIQSSLESRIRIRGEGADGIKMGNNRATNNEANKHHREQNQIHSFYKELAKALLSYSDIFIFGPTTAKDELEHYLFDEMKKEFENKKISLATSDYLTPNQMVARVKEFFKINDQF